VFFSLVAVQAKGLPHRQLVAEAESIRNQLQHVAGVQKVILIGEQKPKIFAEISYRKLATLGVPPDALLGALANQNLIQPAAQVETSSRLVPLRVTGAFDDLAPEAGGFGIGEVVRRQLARPHLRRQTGEDDVARVVHDALRSGPGEANASGVPGRGREGAAGIAGAGGKSCRMTTVFAAMLC
jgi:multidrug efflux pump subunit AcrB